MPPQETLVARVSAVIASAEGAVKALAGWLAVAATPRVTRAAARVAWRVLRIGLVSGLWVAGAAADEETVTAIRRAGCSHGNRRR
jgi:hypothetical protein